MLYFSIQNASPRWDESGLRSGGCEMRFSDRIMFGLCSDYVRIVFLLAEAIHGLSAEVLHVQISWQAQYLVRLVADCACSAHCK